MEKNTMRNPLFADFPEQMAQVLAAGMTPEEGIRILRKDAERKEDQEAIDRMLAVLEDHGELSDAMKASNAFSDRMIRFVSMGEKTGHLESVLRRLQEDGEREYALRRSVKNAIFYPFLITSVMIVILALILIFVMPVFRSAYSGLGMEMTGLQRVLLNLGIFLGRYGLWIILLILAAILITTAFRLNKSAKNSDPGAAVFWGSKADQRNLYVCRMTSILSMAQTSGLPMEEGLSMAEESDPDSEFLPLLKKCKASLENGSSFSDAVRESGFYSRRDIQRITIAENTGSLDVTLNEIADDYQARVDEAAERRVSRVEPILIAVLSGAAALILLSVMLPLLSIMSTL